MYKKFLKATIAIILTSCMLFSGCNINNNKNDNNSFNLETEAKAYSATDFSNLLNVKAIPTEKYYNGNFGIYTNFIDMGAWHGYFLPDETNEYGLGGFAGPTILAKHEYETIAINLSDTISKINITKDNELVDLSKAEISLNYYPGRLSQEYVCNDFTLTLDLVYLTDRTAFIKYNINNTSNKKLSLNLGFEGRIYSGYDYYKRNAISPEIVTIEDGVEVLFNGSNKGLEKGTEFNKFTIRRDVPFATEISEKKYNYTSTMPENIQLKSNANYTIYETQSYTFTEEEHTAEMEKINSLMQNKDSVIAKSIDRWQTYINETFKEKNDVPMEYKNATVKSMMTLMTNWRSPANDILHSGITPSVSSRWFNGLWAWDSWKNALGVAKYNPELAKDAIRTMFDYQIKEGDKNLPYDKGTIIDCIYYTKSNNNTRNSKPPLAAWAVYNIYKQTNDIDFLKEMYPKLVEYHNWWYTNRDIDKNGVAEFGAMVHPEHYLYDNNYNLILDENGNKQVNPEAVIEAAAWESGMDNATRFDIEGLGNDDIGVLVYQSKDENGNVIGYSINQESVDLNSFLYAEKAFLKAMAEVLQLTEDAQKYEQDAKVLADFINNNMFDKQTGFYYDLQTNEDGSVKKLLVNRGKGTEGWLPLWAKLATQSNAEMVKNNIMDEGKFNTTLPFPTASADNKKFAPAKYWRGPVWLDQALFGVESLQNYGYYDEAKEMTQKLFDNANGLLTDGAIHENYNPRSGDALNSPNFSWSAAAFYLLYENCLEDNQNTCQTSFEIVK